MSEDPRTPPQQKSHHVRKGEWASRMAKGRTGPRKHASSDGRKASVLPAAAHQLPALWIDGACPFTPGQLKLKFMTVGYML